MRTWKLVVYPAVIAVAVLFSAACGGSGEKAKPTEGPNPPQGAVEKANPTVSQDLGIGDTFHAVKDGWDITVTAVHVKSARSSMGGLVQEEARGVFLAVDVHLTNTGQSANALGADRFTLSDGQGRKWEAANEDIALEDIGPGLSTEKTLYFDVPPDAAAEVWLETIGDGRISLSGLPAVSSTTVATSAAPTAVPESKYDEDWARKQVEPEIKKMFELLLAQEWNELYDLYSDEARAGCSRSTYVSKAVGTWILATAFGFEEILKAELQDLKEGKLVITFGEITKERIAFTVADGDPTTIVRENGRWLSTDPLGQDCSSLDMETGD